MSRMQNYKMVNKQIINFKIPNPAPQVIIPNLTVSFIKSRNCTKILIILNYHKSFKKDTFLVKDQNSNKTP